LGRRASSPLRVAIVGSGFGGLGTAIRLKQCGIEDFLVFERAAEVGGVWRDNSYPGCACDVQSRLYSFSFAPEPYFTHRYPSQWEIQRYLSGCADRFGVRPHLRLEHEVTAAEWCDDDGVWRLSTPRGEFSARVLVAASGALSEPSLPDVPGLRTFEGSAFHSARWDHGVDLSGKRVAVIGTGASAIQLVPKIQPRCHALYVFQRTPPWILPRGDRPIPSTEQRLLAALPMLERLLRLGVYSSREILALSFFDPRFARLGRWLARRHLERRVRDPALRAKLTPSYAFGCKRVLLSDDYLPAIQAPNVELVTDAIERVGPGSIVAGGREWAVDVLVFATGFRVHEPPLAERVRGRDGRTLADTWAGSMSAHLGTTISGFPNFFLLLGPNTGTGHTSVVTIMESQIAHLLDALRHLERRGLSVLEPTGEAQGRFLREVDSKMRGTVWTSGGCKSWYLDSKGRNSALWPGFTFTLKARLERFDASQYTFRRLA
jgi:cation diffusion facilitator CzcD-associated flavoprotein CzcO